MASTGAFEVDIIVSSDDDGNGTNGAIDMVIDDQLQPRETTASWQQRIQFLDVDSHRIVFKCTSGQSISLTLRPNVAVTSSTPTSATNNLTNGHTPSSSSPSVPSPSSSSSSSHHGRTDDMNDDHNDYEYQVYVSCSNLIKLIGDTASDIAAMIGVFEAAESSPLSASSSSATPVRHRFIDHTECIRGNGDIHWNNPVTIRPSDTSVREYHFNLYDISGTRLEEKDRLATMIVPSSSLVAAGIHNTVISLPLRNDERPLWATRLHDAHTSISLRVTRGTLPSSSPSPPPSVSTSLPLSSSSAPQSTTPKSSPSTPRGSSSATSSRRSSSSSSHAADATTGAITVASSVRTDGTPYGDARVMMIEGAIFTRYTFMRTPADAARRTLIWYEPYVSSSSSSSPSTSSSSSNSSGKRGVLGYLHGSRAPSLLSKDTSNASSARVVEGKSISLDAIRVIACGRAAGKALSTKVGQTASDSHCLVIIAGSGGNERRMELEASSRNQRDTWVRAICTILDHHQRSYTLQGASSMGTTSSSSSRGSASKSGISPSTLANRRARYATMRGTQIPSIDHDANLITSAAQPSSSSGVSSSTGHIASSPSPPSASSMTSAATAAPLTPNDTQPLGPGELGLRAMIEGRSFLLYWPDVPLSSKGNNLIGPLAAIGGESERCDVWLRRTPSSRGIAAGQGPTLFWSRANSRSQLAGQCGALPLLYLTDIYQDRYPTPGFSTRSASRATPTNCLSLVSRAGCGWPSLDMEADHTDVRDAFLHGLSHVLASSDVAIETVDADGSPAMPPADVIAAAAGAARPARSPVSNTSNGSTTSSRRGSDDTSHGGDTKTNNGMMTMNGDPTAPLLTGDWEISVTCRSLAVTDGMDASLISPLVALNDGNNGKLIGNTEFKRNTSSPVFSKKLVLRLPSATNSSNIDVPQLLKFSVYLVDSDMKVADDSRLACITLQLHELFELKTVTSSTTSMKVWNGREVTIPLRNNDRTDIDTVLQSSSSLIILKCSPLRRVSMHMTPNPTTKHSEALSHAHGHGHGHAHTPATMTTNVASTAVSPSPLLASSTSQPVVKRVTLVDSKSKDAATPKSSDSSSSVSPKLVSQMDKSKDHLPWHIIVEAKSLIKKDWLSNLNPRVVLQDARSGVAIDATECILRNADPIFERRLILPGNTPLDKELKLDIYDVDVSDRSLSYDRMRHDDWIGCCLFTLAQLCTIDHTATTATTNGGVVLHKAHDLPIHNPLQPLVESELLRRGSSLIVRCNRAGLIDDTMNSRVRQPSSSPTAATSVSVSSSMPVATTPTSVTPSQPSSQSANGLTSSTDPLLWEIAIRCTSLIRSDNGSNRRVDPQVILSDGDTHTILDRTEYIINTLDPIFERTLVLPRPMSLHHSSSHIAGTDQDRLLRFTVIDHYNNSTIHGTGSSSSSINVASSSSSMAYVTIRWSMLLARATGVNGYTLPLRHDTLPETDLRLLRASSSLHVQLRRRLPPLPSSSSSAVAGTHFSIRSPSPARLPITNNSNSHPTHTHTNGNGNNGNGNGNGTGATATKSDDAANELQSVMQEIQRLRLQVDRMRT